MNLKSKAKTISHSKFFKKPTAEEMNEVQYLQHILQASCFEPSHPEIKKKLILTSEYILLFNSSEEGSGQVLIRELDSELRFKRIVKVAEKEPKTVSIYGFSLVSKSGKTTSFQFQFSNLAELWVQHLSKTLIEVGFHLHYEIIKKIGNGSSATVCSVRRLRDGETFAAKVFSKQQLEDEKKRKSFEYEIELLRALQHPNIIKTFGIFESQVSYFVVTELLSGGNLLERINLQKGLSIEQTRQITRGVIKALAYLHKFDIMHRDIKLQNIMLRQVEGWEPVLVDFGLGVFCDDEPYIHYRCGTPGYIAPEIITMTGKHRIEVACDIFSAGALLHVMLTNNYLFPGKNTDEIYEKNKAFAFNLDEENYNLIDQQGKDLLGSMLEFDFIQRITAEECLEHNFLYQAEAQEQKEGISPGVTQMSSAGGFLFP